MKRARTILAVAATDTITKKRPAVQLLRKAEVKENHGHDRNMRADCDEIKTAPVPDSHSGSPVVPNLS